MTFFVIQKKQHRSPQQHFELKKRSVCVSQRPAVSFETKILFLWFKLPKIVRCAYFQPQTGDNFKKKIFSCYSNLQKSHENKQKREHATVPRVDSIASVSQNPTAKTNPSTQHRRQTTIIRTGNHAKTAAHHEKPCRLIDPDYVE